MIVSIESSIPTFKAVQFHVGLNVLLADAGPGVSCTRFRRHRIRCFMEQEVCHGETSVYAGVQA
jgi:hypothetical protein